MKLILLAFILSFSAISQAAVWNDSNYWDSSWEQRYVSWVQSPRFNRDIFISPSSRWNGTKTDCADAAYGMRIIFAYENNLPFAMNNPNGSRRAGEKLFTNKTTGFDHIPAGPQRVKAFIEYLGDMVGTDNLARNDTYATELSAITSGHMYIFKYPNVNTRHAFLVKSMASNGNPMLYSSTTPKIARKLLLRNGMPDQGFDGRPWGFKKFKQPQFYARGFVYPYEARKSDEMYALVNRVGRKRIVSEIQKRVATQTEDLGSKITRMIGNTCRSLQSRIEVVNMAVNFVRNNRNRCLNASDYHAHSTPSRDGKINNSINGLKSTWMGILNARAYNRVPQNVFYGLNYLVGKTVNPQGRVVNLNRGDTTGKYELTALCNAYIQIPGQQAFSVDFRDFSDLYASRRLSSHPNDSALRRWGRGGNSTRCRAY